MKRTILAVLLAATAFLSVASIMTRSARAEIVVFTASLLATNEVAPVAVHPTEVNTVGTAVVTLDVTRSGSTITAATARFEVTVSGAASNSILILAHIHRGAAGVNGPIEVDSGLSPGAPVPLAGGGGSFTRSNLPVSTADATDILANPAGFYFNIHTALSPSGVARGQLVPQQTGGPGLTVPTLSEWGAILMFLLLGAVATFFLVGRKAAFAGPGAEESMVMAPPRAINWKVLGMVSLYVEAAIGLGLALISLATRVTVLDAGGSLLSGLILAFIIHLMIGAKRRN